MERGRWVGGVGGGQGWWLGGGGGGQGRADGGLGSGVMRMGYISKVAILGMAIRENSCGLIY